MPDASRPRDRARIPFWAHQLAEILLALGLLVEGARSNSPAVVLGAGAALLLFSLATDGPLAAWRVLGRRAHRIGDFVLAGLLACSPLIFGVTEPLAVALLVGAAASLVWLGVRGEFASPTPRARRGARPARAGSARGGAAPDAATEPGAVPAPRPDVTRTSTRDVGRALGRLRVAGPRVVGRVVGRSAAARAAERDPQPGDAQVVGRARGADVADDLGTDPDADSPH